MTPHVHTTIVEHVRLGAYKTHAAQAAGVSYDAVADWIKRGFNTGEEPYHTFAVEITRALAEDAIRNQAAISKAAASGDWKAAAWNLERKHPKLYGLGLRETEDGSEQWHENALVTLHKHYYGQHAEGEVIDATPEAGALPAGEDEGCGPPDDDE